MDEESRNGKDTTVGLLEKEKEAGLHGSCSTVRSTVRGGVRGACDRAFRVHELSTVLFYRDLMSELVACTTFLSLFVFVQLSLNPKMYTVSLTHIAVMVGVLVFVLVEGHGHVGGCHINPAVSWGLLLNGRITFIRAIFYTAMQVCGCLAGATFAYSLTPEQYRDGYSPLLPAAGMTCLQSVLVETLLTFHLVFTVLSVSDARHRPVTLAGLPCGMAVCSCILAAVYWAGPYIGSTLAAAVYGTFMLLQDNYGSEEAPTDSDTTSESSHG